MALLVHGENALPSRFRTPERTSRHVCARSRTAQGSDRRGDDFLVWSAGHWCVGVGDFVIDRCRGAGCKAAFSGRAALKPYS